MGTASLRPSLPPVVPHRLRATQFLSPSRCARIAVLVLSANVSSDRVTCRPSCPSARSPTPPRSPTESNDSPARVVDDLLDQATDVAVALGKVERTELGRRDTVVRVRAEDSAALTLVADDCWVGRSRIALRAGREAGEEARGGTGNGRGQLAVLRGRKPCPPSQPRRNEYAPRPIFDYSQQQCTDRKSASEARRKAKAARRRRDEQRKSRSRVSTPCPVAASAHRVTGPLPSF